LGEPLCGREPEPSDCRRDVDTQREAGLTLAVEPVRFVTRIRYWNEEKGSGLAVADIPPDDAAALGGLKQQHVSGTVQGTPFVSNIMPARSGRLALSVSKAMMSAAGVGVGDPIEVEISAVGRG